MRAFWVVIRSNRLQAPAGTPVYQDSVNLPGIQGQPGVQICIASKENTQVVLNQSLFRPRLVILRLWMTICRQSCSVYHQGCRGIKLLLHFCIQNHGTRCYHLEGPLKHQLVFAQFCNEKIKPDGLKMNNLCGSSGKLSIKQILKVSACHDRLTLSLHVLDFLSIQWAVE